LIEDREKTSALAVARLQHQGAEGRAEREGGDPGDNDGDGDGDGKLFVELARDAAQETHRHEDGAEYKYDRDHRSTDLIHRLLGCILRRESLSDVALDVLHHNNCVVDHHPDGKDHPEEREGVDRKAERLHAGKGTDEGDRHSYPRNQRRAPTLEEQIHDEDDQHHRLRQSFDHLFDGHFDKFGRVVRDIVGDPRWETLRYRVHFLPDSLHRVEGIRTRRQEGQEKHIGFAVPPAFQTIGLSAQLDLRDIF
jgi:hypothetical protein